MTDELRVTRQNGTVEQKKLPAEMDELKTEVAAEDLVLADKTCEVEVIEDGEVLHVYGPQVWGV